MNVLDQYSRNKNLELDNVEQYEGENVEEIVIKTAHLLNFNINKDDIDAAHRIPSRKVDRPNKIIVQLISRKKRDLFIDKKRVTITNDQLTGSGNNNRIFIN